MPAMISHPIHLHRHSFELPRIAGQPTPWLETLSSCSPRLFESRNRLSRERVHGHIAAAAELGLKLFPR
jgi:hypothetical protein